jgi:hypothetical protein
MYLEKYELLIIIFLKKDKEQYPITNSFKKKCSWQTWKRKNSKLFIQSSIRFEQRKELFRLGIPITSIDHEVEVKLYKMLFRIWWDNT